MKIATITSLSPIQHPSCRLIFEEGREIVTSSGFGWLEDGSGRWIYTRNLQAGRKIRDLGAPWKVDRSWEAGWLAGAFDGEGWLSSRKPGGRPGNHGSGWHVGFVQNPGAVLDLCVDLINKRGYETRAKAQAGRDIKRLLITGVYDCFRFLGECRPVRLIEKSRPWVETGSPARSRGSARNRRYCLTVAAIESLGMRDTIAIQTSTKTLFSEGLFTTLAG